MLFAFGWRHAPLSRAAELDARLVEMWGGQGRRALWLTGSLDSGWLVVVRNKEASWAGAGRRLDTAAAANEILRAGIL